MIWEMTGDWKPDFGPNGPVPHVDLFHASVRRFSPAGTRIGSGQRGGAPGRNRSIRRRSQGYGELARNRTYAGSVFKRSDARVSFG